MTTTDRGGEQKEKKKRELGKTAITVTTIEWPLWPMTGKRSSYTER